MGQITRNSISNLATTLAYEKKADESIALFEKLLESASKAEGPALSDAHYQFAAGLSILGRKDDSFRQLDAAVKAGFDDADQLSTDDDLKPLRGDARFAALVDEIKKKQPQAEIYTYPDAPHGFYCDERASYRKEAGDLAWKRTQEFLAKHMKK